MASPPDDTPVLDLPGLSTAQLRAVAAISQIGCVAGLLLLLLSMSGAAFSGWLHYRRDAECREQCIAAGFGWGSEDCKCSALDVPRG